MSNLANLLHVAVRQLPDRRWNRNPSDKSVASTSRQNAMWLKRSYPEGFRDRGGSFKIRILVSA